MSYADLAVERRLHARYKVIDVSAVVGERKLGQIIDMSLGGLSFRYIENGPEEGGRIDLGILFGTNGHYLEKLPTEVVSDTVLSQGSPSHPMAIRKRSLKFLNLTDKQREQLASFIKVHAAVVGG
jgi:hypothetical protein